MTRSSSPNREARYELHQIGVEVAGKTHRIVNVSSSGILIKMPTSGLSVGQELHFELHYPTTARPIRLVMNGVIRRLTPGGVAIEHIAPAVTWKRLLNRHVTG